MTQSAQWVRIYPLSALMRSVSGLPASSLRL
jgi:hypothetical protein